MDSIDLKNILVIKTKDETLFIKKEKISLVCYSKKDHTIYLKGVGEYLGKIDSVFIPFIDGNFEKRMNELCLTIQGVLDKKENHFIVIEYFKERVRIGQNEYIYNSVCDWHFSSEPLF